MFGDYTADQHRCFGYLDVTMVLYILNVNRSFYRFSHLKCTYPLIQIQTSLCQVKSETHRTCFHIKQLFCVSNSLMVGLG